MRHSWSAAIILMVSIGVGCNKPKPPADSPPTNNPKPTAVVPQQITPSVPVPVKKDPPAKTQLVTADPKIPWNVWVSYLDKVEVPQNVFSGNWTKTPAGLRVQAAQRASIGLGVAPSEQYDFRVSFTRNTGKDSVALFFTHGTGQTAFEVDAWGKHLAGIQNISGKSVQDNPTRKENMTLTNGQRYTMTVEVRSKQIRAFLDGQVVATYSTDGSDLSYPDAWPIEKRLPLAVGAWESDTTIHTAEIRAIPGEGTSVAQLPPPVPKAVPKNPDPAPKTEIPVPQPVAKTPDLAPKTETPKNPASNPVPKTETPKNPDPAPAQKNVLIVIANYHFFYREYADPRAELERAGMKVTVAAGQKGACRPHPDSGQGADGGVVQADIALADVKAKDYDAILFSGGWGASSYQFAFTGRYNEAAYNGAPAVKAAANRVINEFVAQNKYVGAVCNGVSVLAWARVNGKSPLQGKRVCAPVLQAPPGIYDGRAAQPSTRWHPESNGANVSPAGSIGRPGTPEDDVLVDGRIVTGENDLSAREIGRRLVSLLSAK